LTKSLRPVIGRIVEKPFTPSKNGKETDPQGRESGFGRPPGAEAGTFPPGIASSYDGKPDQRAFDIWAHRVTIYVKYCRIFDGQVMRMFSSACHRKGAVVFYDMFLLPATTHHQ
jgi:hypothetical protein